MINLQQIQCIISLNQFRHYQRAADALGITQPALTHHIQQLERTYHVVIFDRSRKPLIPTPEGERIIELALAVAQSHQVLMEAVQNLQTEEMEGSFTLGILPTIAPYLCPYFLPTLQSKYPRVQWRIKEWMTQEIQSGLKSGTIDAAILSIPPASPQFHFLPLYQERLSLYIAPRHPLHEIKELLENHLHQIPWWMLREGHCFRNQTINLCQPNPQLIVCESHSLEALKKMVDSQHGITIFPESMVITFSEEDRQNVRPWPKTTPVRQIALVYTRTVLKSRMLRCLSEEINMQLPFSLPQVEDVEVISTETC